MFRLLALLSLLAPLALHAQDVRVVTRVVTDTVPAWKTWKEHGFTMNHPGGWAVDMSPAGDTVVVFRQGGQVAGEMPASVIVQGVDGKLPPLDKRLKRAKRQGVEMLHGEADEAAAERAEYRYEAMGTVMHVLEHTVEQGDRAYLLTYAAPEAAFEEYLFLAEAMLNSFSASAD